MSKVFFDNMKEKVLIRSNNDYAKEIKDKATIAVVGAFVFLLFLLATNGFWGIIGSILPSIILLLDIAFLLISIGFLIFAISIQKVELIVTDKRVYGITYFNKRVDLPLDSISAVGISMFKGIAIGTSSGRIIFKGIGNRDEIHNAINELLLSRQQKSTSVITDKLSNADELKKYKELLDSGVITQEEFDAKKKDLLGL